ncbi:UDP-N-acetylglucosamine 2-epimerase (hydrolyzing) [Thermanaerosceptrum fracticalcis]|uniref:UDP-N-acetylglucosamine 2-epimerase (Hydrolyzing) n=2 Tax=Thermanaerosceptrum fracticalcis TaxID=1712410 RepID=A0A7G6E8K9_THEFR|nr:UDP-N-acetylglucosamine 2-epimerase (hydrolyzing) [Thermanaerosceptrum fracticalcis]
MCKKKICVVTGSRAEYGLLYWLMKLIKDDDELELQVAVTGMHLSPEFGLTYQQILRDGFTIDAKIEMQMSSDTPVGITKSLGLGVIGFADALERLQPDLLVVLGDRYEIFAAVQAALIAKIPVGHIAGGDTTEGAIDEAIRHSITKMAHLHFVTNTTAYKRVRQMGENPEYIFNVGSPGLDQIQRLTLLDRLQLEAELGYTFREKNILVTFHPVTLDNQSPEEQFNELLHALDFFGENLGVVFTKTNSDTYGRVINYMIDAYTERHPNTKAYTSLGQLKYLSLMAQVDAVVGNSSSGLYEAPSFRKPTVNIGDRQKGRLQASSVINCEPIQSAIIASIKEAFSRDCEGTINPYGDGHSSERILKILKNIPSFRGLLKKHFFEVKE